MGMKLPTELTTITLVSRLTALVLIIALPILGFLLGYQQGAREVDDEQLFTSFPPSLTETDPIFSTTTSETQLSNEEIADPSQQQNAGGEGTTPPRQPVTTSPNQVVTSPDTVTTSPGSNAPVPVPGSMPGSGASSDPYNPDDSADVVVKPKFPPHQTSDTCGVTNCHGASLTCGQVDPNNGLMCTMDYQLGDGCRQYASCGVVNGSCQQVKDPRHAKCVSCVELCKKETDSMKVFECEARCTSL